MCIVYFILTASILQLAACVFITIGYGSGYYIQDNFPPDLPISSFKLIIADQIGLCPSAFDIIDSYPNVAQDLDGWARLLENKTLYDYGINDFSLGTKLIAVRRVHINNNIHLCQTHLTVTYLDKSTIRIPLDGQQTVLELKQLLAVKLGIPVKSQSLADWYDNVYINADEGQMLDHKQLAEYGFTTGSVGKIICVGIETANHQVGRVTVIYSTTLIQRHIPVNILKPVWLFKLELSQLLSIPAAGMSITTLNRNQLQDLDNGIWNDYKYLYEYEMQYYTGIVLLVLTRDSRTELQYY